MASVQPVIVRPDDSSPAPVQSTTLSVVASEAAEPQPTPSDSMLSLAYYHLRQQSHELRRQGLRVGHACEPEAVHETRIATRKLRAALRAFKDLLPETERIELNQELRWLAAELGKLRDLDVYRDKLAIDLRSLPAEDRRALSDHPGEVGAARDEAVHGVQAVLRSDRYRELMSWLEAFAQSPPAGAQRRWGQFLIRDGVNGYLDKALHRVLKRGRKIEPRSHPEKLHELRIAGKKFRYLLEVFAPLYPRALKRPLKAVRALQKVLGEHQDACFAQQRLRAQAMASETGKHEVLALGRLVEIHARKAARIDARFEKHWLRFEAGQAKLPSAH